MTFVYESVNTRHKVVDAKGQVTAEFKPDPEDTPENREKGKFPVRGLFVTEDPKLAQQLESLGSHGISRAAGGEDPTKKPAASDPNKDPAK